MLMTWPEKTYKFNEFKPKSKKPFVLTIDLNEDIKPVKFSRNDIMSLDKELGEAIKNPYVCRILVCTLAIAMKASNACADVGAFGGKLISVQQQLYQIILIVARAGCILACAAEITKAILTGSSLDITKIVSKYIVYYLALIAVPWIMDLIQELFR